MSTGAAVPDLDTFRALARDRRVIPVTRRLLADGDTPVGVYGKLAGSRAGTFLLESAEHGLWSRYSFVGARSHATLTERDGQAQWIGEPPVGVPLDGDPLKALRKEHPRPLRLEAVLERCIRQQKFERAIVLRDLLKRRTAVDDRKAA